MYKRQQNLLRDVLQQITPPRRGSRILIDTQFNKVSFTSEDLACAVRARIDNGETFLIEVQ